METAPPGGPAPSARKLDVAVAGGLAWTAGAKWLTQGLTWASLLILARVLSPVEFGISEKASIFYGVTNVLAEFGISTAVVQMQELGRKSLVHLHTFSCLLCTGAFAVSLLFVPWIARFFHIEDQQSLIAFNNAAFLIAGFQAIPMGLLQRDLDYRRMSIAEAVHVTVQSIVTVAAALLGAGYWSLALGAGVGRLASASLAFSWKPIAFTWPPQWSELREPLTLGRQVAVGRLAWSTYTLSDGIIVGRLFSEGVLGSYRMAMNLAAAPAEKISTLLMRAAGPLFAKIQNDHALVRRYYLILTELLVMMVLPMMVGLALVAPRAVQVILGEKWMGAVQPLQWLAVFMVFRTHRVLTELVLISQRKTRYTMRMSMLNLLLMPAAFYAAAQWYGPTGVAAAWMLLTPITIAPLLWVTARSISLKFSELLNTVWPTLAGTGAMFLALYFLQPSLDAQPWPPIVLLTVQVALGGAVYAAVLLLFFRQRVMRYLRFIKNLRGEGALLSGTGA